MSRAANELLPELTSFIEGLAEPRILVDLDYRILAANKAYRDAFAAHESVVGRRCYEVSHHYTRPCDEAGESCPRRSALASRRTEHVLHIHHTPRGDEHVQVELNPVRDSSGEIRFLVERMQSLPTARAAASSQGLIGRSPRFREMLELAARVARPKRRYCSWVNRHGQGNGHAPHSRGQPALRGAPRRRRLLGSHRDTVRE